MTEPSEQETYRKGVDERFDHQDGLLERILMQATKTNGRVNILETNEKIKDAQIRIITRLLYAIGAGLFFLIGQIIVPIFSAHI